MHGTLEQESFYNRRMVRMVSDKLCTIIFSCVTCQPCSGISSKHLRMSRVTSNVSHVTNQKVTSYAPHYTIPPSTRGTSKHSHLAPRQTVSCSPKVEAPSASRHKTRAGSTCVARYSGTYCLWCARARARLGRVVLSASRRYTLGGRGTCQ